jgi:16S rRNA (cytosine967-C5)-methyltransferase
VDVSSHANHSNSPTSARHCAWKILQNIYRQGIYTDLGLDRGLKSSQLSREDRGLVTTLVYGTVRRQRTLDQLINQLGKKKAHQQPLELRLLLHLGLYQLRYLTQIPASAAVNTSVELAKKGGLKGLSGVVNGILRHYLRLAEKEPDPLQLPEELTSKLGILYSFPDWIIQLWLTQFGETETEKLCQWFNQTPTFDIRINPLKTSLQEVQNAFAENNLPSAPLPNLPQGLRLLGKTGDVKQLPGFQAGWWTLQDSSAQLVSHFLNPQPGETIIDACAAPGGKTTHIAELMGDQGLIHACDRVKSRLQQVGENGQRLQLQSLKLCLGDARELSQFNNQGDRVLLDAPCSGLGILHKRPDIRWRQNPEKLAQVAQLQRELIEKTALWVKPQGILVYATCTLNPLENEQIIDQFLETHQNWQIVPPDSGLINNYTVIPPGYLKVLPHHHDMDGFFMVKLQKNLESF